MFLSKFSLCIASIGFAIIAMSGVCDAVAQNSTSDNRVKVEERKSSKANRAKGDINFDDLKFDIEKDSAFKEAMLTDEIRSLNGKKVKLRGYILPATLFSEVNIKQFILVRDNQECCFGPGAALYDCVWIEMVPGAKTDFVTRPVTVEGTFKIDTERFKIPGAEELGGNSHHAIYQIDGISVR